MDIEGKILVLIRMRPLSKKEIAKNEVSVWECINDTTIVYKNRRQEHAGFPTTYTFDRVFSGDKSTREVYDEGVKEIALLVVQGINSTIFAYGQTSTGKTYTMKGVTEYAIADIYDYVEKHEERTFVLKFSAIEIYNEAVRDLLSTDSQPLRILDDPTKGIIVEKLKEETVRNLNHLKHLISECEVRRTRETVLNECSSRSHQILKLTVESSDKECSGKGNPTKLSASLNFVDLAGSERASQAMSSESKLKEGRHINRSLLTLGTVIRKLSKGKQGHVNYRDSKLTRILQSSLGGNARTAIICTLSPTISHVEQSRNTLLFASCAKEVSTKATVNVVIQENYLVQQLQNKISRLEIELENKNLQIKQMDKDIREISRQRELAESRVEELLLDIENLRSSAKMENQSSSRNITAEKVEEILPRREEQTWENRLSSSLFDGDSLFRSSSFSRASTERAFVEALVQNLQASEEGGVPSVHSFVKVLKEAQAHFERQPDSQGAPLDEKLQKESSDAVTSGQPEACSISNWPQEFARQREAIINLWQSCNVSLVHRTYFFLLFKGDPSDSIYMEVELRRLTFLKQTYSAEHQLPEDDHRSIGLSAKALYQERKKLSKLMQKRYTKEERNILFQKWGIELESKERKLQLLNSIWTNADDLQHMAQSAEIVARLIKFSEQGKGIKGMLGLSFDSPPRKRRSVSWRSGSWRESIASLI